MNKLYLIQTARICRPFDKYADSRLSRAVSLDYMGAAEYEFGATAKSLRALQASTPQIRLITDLCSQGLPLRVYSALTDADFEKYAEQLEALSKGSMRLKEPCYFDDAVRSNRLYPDFWWDLQNHVMFSFDKQFMDRLPEHLAGSFAVMNAMQP